VIVEHLLVFYGLVGLFVVAHVPGGPIPALVLGGAAAVTYLGRTREFDNRDLWRPEALRPALPAMVARWAVFSVLATAGVAVLDRGHLFDMPREQTLLWLLIVVFYPLASVYPQEVLYRAFLLHRYRRLLRTERVAAGASAIAFGFAHLLFGNVLAVVLTVGGGWLFARRYQRSRSLLTVSVEHALYGITIFTVGLGRFFYHGA
jgi:uncharacterized protein